MLQKAYRFCMASDRDSFLTSSLALATYLCAKDQQVVGISPTENYSKKEFVFASNERLEELAHAYKFGDRNHPDLQVQVHKYDQRRNDLLDRLNE